MSQEYIKTLKKKLELWKEIDEGYTKKPELKYSHDAYYASGVIHTLEIIIKDLEVLLKK